MVKLLEEPAPLTVRLPDSVVDVPVMAPTVRAFNVVFPDTERFASVAVPLTVRF